ncbi:MAG: 50S ribosomal protein L1, partial [Planctomycetes bacterium]|nr:50S ribosomal protein L1 [Planctomycetota bacterium]
AWHKSNLTQVAKDRRFSLSEAIDLIHNKFKPVKFDETVELAIQLGVDVKKSDQMVRGAVSLPRGIGKELRVVVFTKEDRVQEALDAGAIKAGGQGLAKEVQDGFMDFDVAIATPDVMSIVGKLGKVLGPQGKMPSPKAGTVTKDIAKAVQEYKAGKIEFRADSGGNVHAPMGKRSFPKEALLENIQTFIDYVKSIKPPAARGQYIISIALTTTMGPGIPIEQN